MPQMADITIKKADGTTDVVYNAVSPSAGDSIPAIWRPNGVGASAYVRPVFTLASRFNGPRTARRVQINHNFPIVTQVGGVDTVSDRCIFEGSFLVPERAPDTSVDEFVEQTVNLVKSALVEACLKTRTSAT